MITVTVKGNTYPIRKVLKDNLFNYNEFDRCWYRRVTESDLNSVIDTLKPMQVCDDYDTPKFYIKIERPDEKPKFVDRGFF